MLFIILTFILYWLRIRVVNHLTKFHWKILRIHILIIWILSTSLVAYFPKIIEYLWINSSKFINSLNIKTILSYSIYMLFLSVVIYLGYVWKALNKFYFLKIIFFASSFTLLTIGWFYLHFPNFIIYFLIVAFIEEFVKYVFWYSLFDKYKIHYTDLILFCLISAFWFAVIENIVYAYHSIEKINTINFMTKVSVFTKTMVQRWFINIAVHTLFTWIIWYFTIQKIPIQNKNISNQNTLINNYNQNNKNYKIPFVTILKIITGILLWVGIHAFFNITTAKRIVFVLPIVVLIGYIFLSYVFYKSDTFFIEKK